MTHNVRENAQFITIEKMMNDIKVFHSKCLIVVLDHKKNIIPQNHREGKLEY